MDVASFLKKITDVLSERRTRARDLEALEFAADGHDVSIRVRSKPHGSLYPPLGRGLRHPFLDIRQFLEKSRDR